MDCVDCVDCVEGQKREKVRDSGGRKIGRPGSRLRVEGGVVGCLVSRRWVISVVMWAALTFAYSAKPIHDASSCEVLLPRPAT